MDENSTRAESYRQLLLQKYPDDEFARILSDPAYYEKKLDGNNVEINEFGNFFGSEDFKEGTQAFLTKRPATFKGK